MPGIVEVFLLLLLLGIVLGYCVADRPAKPRAIQKPRPLPRPVPFGDHILIRPIAADTLIGGLQAPESNRARPSMGQVVLVGPGKRSETGDLLAMEVEPGEVVSFPSFAGQEIFNPLDLPDGTYLMVRQEELYLNHGNKTRTEEIA